MNTIIGVGLFDPVRSHRSARVNFTGGRIVNVTSCLGQIESEGSQWGGVPDSPAYKGAITGARTLQQLNAIGFHANDIWAATDARCGRLPCPVYKYTKAMLNKVRSQHTLLLLVFILNYFWQSLF